MDKTGLAPVQSAATKELSALANQQIELLRSGAPKAGTAPGSRSSVARAQDHRHADLMVQASQISVKMDQYAKTLQKAWEADRRGNGLELPTDLAKGRSVCPAA